MRRGQSRKELQLGIKGVGGANGEIRTSRQPGESGVSVRVLDQR